MPRLRIAVATRCFEQPLKSSLQAANAIGAEGVQLDARDELKPGELSQTGRRELLHRLDEMGLAVASLSFPAQRAFYDMEQLDARIEAVKETMRLAFQLKSGIVTARVGRLPVDPASPDYELLVAVLNDLARFGNQVGATFAFTPAGEPPDVLMQLLARVTEGPLGINFDPAAYVIAGREPPAALRTLHASVWHMRIRDAIREMDGSGLEVPLGRGEVQWDEFLALVDEIGYRGWLTVDRTTGDDKRNDAARAIQYIRRVGAG